MSPRTAGTPARRPVARPRQRHLGSRTHTLSTRLASAAALLLLAAFAALAQTTYRKPPQAVLDVLNAPVPPAASISPARDYMLLLTGVRYPPISELAQPMLRLAGLRINPNISGPHRAPTFVAVSVKKISDGTETKVALPAEAQAGVPAWSADGRHFAFTNTTPAGLELWVGETATAKVRKIKNVAVNAVYGEPLQWMPDGKTLLVQLVPAKRAAAPVAPGVPVGPNEQESTGRATGAATFQDLLKNPHDADLFDYYATAQLALVDATGGKVTPLGSPSVYEEAAPAPDGRHLLVTRVHRPYSYLHPAFAFPREIEVWDTAGKSVHKVASVPLADNVPLQGVRTGPRAVQWRPTAPATLLWAEALDGGDPRKKVTHRDRLMTLSAPFKSPATELFKVEHRYSGAQWGERGGLLLVSDYDRDKRWTRTQAIDADSPAAAPRTIFSRSINDQYGNPGTPVTRLLPTGHRAVL
ncbi:MAG TPA: hypothetical protein VF064_06800, partial [Pyrinomonadaceae bacterium]